MVMYFTQEQYETLTRAMLNRSNDKSRTVIHLSFEECERYCEHYLSNKMKELKKITNAVIGRLENDKTNFDDRERYELKDLSYEVFVLTLGTYNPKANCSFKTFLYGNLLRKFYTYGRDKTRKSRCNWEQVWDDEHHCYKRDENGNIVKKPVFDISMYSKKANSKSNSEGDGREIWESFEYKKDFVNELIERENNKEDEFSKEMKEYLESLSSIQVRILKLVANGFEKEEIVSTLCISKELYSDSIRAIKDIKRIRLLTRKDGR